MAADPVNKIQLARIAHVYYKYKPDEIEKAKEFMKDFGFFEVKKVGPRIYYRGYGSEPFVLAIEEADKTEFGGAAFAVDTLEELERATKVLPKEAKVTDVYEMKDAPGGGKAVTLYDPVDGWPMHIVWGQEKVEAMDPKFPEQVYKTNYPEKHHRDVNEVVRLEKRPTPVHKMGHYGMCVTDFKKTFDFYSTHFNFFPSELVQNEAGETVTVFFRLDRGEEKVDHHTFFFFPGPEFHVHHSSFETHDFDAQVLGHDWLREKGYENCWGVGRHIMGSQIFDYWFDPSRFVMEHYVDGDLLNNQYPTQKSKAGPGTLHVWGPDVPLSFLK